MVTTSSKYETVIGLETHVQVRTNSKMFCSCSADYQKAEPNTFTCPVCAGLPGALPTVNKRAVEFAIKIALGLNCEIDRHCRFDRKNYSYPDLVKGYQISQADRPIGHKGHLRLEDGEGVFTIRINRVHMEEDVAKLHHEDGYALMDLNRSGVPLMEVVTEPDFRSAERAGLYIEELQRIVRFLGVSDANMEDGSFRCDANVSVRPAGDPAFGTKVEVKNMNRIGAVVRALNYEVERQIKLLEGGEAVRQETRGWNDKGQKTYLQRLKEESSDYRYFPEPDIPPLSLSEEWVEQIKSDLPQLSAELRARLRAGAGEEGPGYALSKYDAGLIAASRDVYDYFEEAVASLRPKGDDVPAVAKALANWLNSEMAHHKNTAGVENISSLNITPAQFAEVVEMFRAGKLNNANTKRLLEATIQTGKSPAELLKEQDLTSLDDEDALREMARDIIKQNPAAVKDYRAGKQASVQFLMGQMMKATKGRAAPAVARELILGLLAEG